jgi:pimeloyl-ACP methyl ester carboxylesterase
MTQLMRHAGQKVMILFIIVHALGAYSMPYAYASPLPSPTARPSSEEGYSERELFFANGEVRLAGTLILPQGDGPFPAVVLLHGAGPDMRHVYRPDAKTFVQAGIAAFIYDKRGTGQSGGDWRTASLFDLADDALAAVRLLRQQPEILAQQVGLWGVSQGGWLTPFAAARSDQVAFIVQVTAAALPLANQEMWGVGNELHRRGFSDQALDTTMKAMHLLFSTRPLIHRGLVQLDDLWFVTYDPYLDPASAWPQVKQPALIFYGALDATVPTRTSLDVMQNFLTPGRSTIVLSDKGHGLGGPERNNNRQYVETMTNWVHAVSRSAPMPGINVSGDTVQNGELRWYGMGPMKTVWYSTAGFQLFLIGLFILVFIIGLVTSLVRGNSRCLPVPSWV